MATLIPYIGSLSVGFAVIAFILAVMNESEENLPAHLGRASAAGAVPSAITLIYGAFDPAILSQVPGLNIPIAFGGLSLLYVSYKAMRK
jgi:hypothetical protein